MRRTRRTRNNNSAAKSPWRPPDPRRASEWSSRSSPRFRESAYQESLTRAPERPPRRRDGRRAIARVRRPGSVNFRFIACVAFGDSEERLFVKSTWLPKDGGVLGGVFQRHGSGGYRLFRCVLRQVRHADPSARHTRRDAPDASRRGPQTNACGESATRFLLRRRRLETRRPDSTAPVKSRASPRRALRIVPRD